MICQFFKFSTMEHFWGLKWIAWVDFRVVLLFYSFQGVRFDVGGELEKLTKYTLIWKYSKFMLLDFDSLYQRKNSSPSLCVIHIQKLLDLLFHLVCLELVVWYENPPKFSSENKYIFLAKSLYLASQDALEVMYVSQSVSVLRQYWCDSGDWGYLLETWLKWLWWLRVPIRDLTGESYLVMKVI